MKNTILILVLLLFSCGTKTKNKQSLEFIEKINSEVVEADSINQLEKIISERVEERLIQYRQENRNDLSDKVKITETTETLDYSGGEPLIIESPQGIVRISGNGRITRHTKTAYQELERRSIEKMNVELASKLQHVLDSINEKSITRQVVRQTAKEIVTKKKEENKEVKTQINFWVYFWIIIIIIIVYFGYRMYMKYGSPLGWIKLFLK